MTPRRRAISPPERLAVVEDRMDTMQVDITQMQVKLDRLLDLANERSHAVANVQQSMTALQGSVVALKADTKIIRDGMGFARILRRLALWGTPIVVALLWAFERFDLLLKLFRKP